MSSGQVLQAGDALSVEQDYISRPELLVRDRELVSEVKYEAQTVEEAGQGFVLTLGHDALGSSSGIQSLCAMIVPHYGLPINAVAVLPAVPIEDAAEFLVPDPCAPATEPIEDPAEESFLGCDLLAVDDDGAGEKMLRVEGEGEREGQRRESGVEKGGEEGEGIGEGGGMDKDGAGRMRGVEKGAEGVGERGEGREGRVWVHGGIRGKGGKGSCIMGPWWNPG